MVISRKSNNKIGHLSESIYLPKWNASTHMVKVFREPIPIKTIMLLLQVSTFHERNSKCNNNINVGETSKRFILNHAREFNPAVNGSIIFVWILIATNKRIAHSCQDCIRGIWYTQRTCCVRRTVQWFTNDRVSEIWANGYFDKKNIVNIIINYWANGVN